ncbi:MULTISPECIES: GNAT family N-acetyltransferase [Acinetobacter]|jgi:L-amino acid N-acyltransferase|uniref:N-acetyltransferase n=1 Tax=Acinetobacter pollinis TaxID=2605270 RepID=A0ABU6DVY5_9GAMM|nr:MULTISPECIES: GNAT family N-acetyltransferase [Acinetobacter]MBF7690170.1 N-acetyltransferase [Acinetobacter pollinis]MBF7693106.1 N-acetyltransferase [Acinetobacter pollinis]MBF7697589.1 N-acetyltransferase [Acinetobacter pollinis]MBF7699730.1 N-acetyltransferase [Acinetobacter pollinis]MEB5477018.1 N-acetyltransferase [Acinetobacter pollinis]
MTSFQVIRCTFEQHGKRILEIFNDAILNSTALYEYKERTLQDVEKWFELKRSMQFPVIGLENEHGILMGFVTYGAFRNFPAYVHTVEHSVYIHKEFRGCGLGRKLMEEIIQEAKKNNIHVMIGGIDAQNEGSIRLHEKLGFRLVGTLPEVGFKFDRWLDLAFYQLILSNP